MTDIRNDSPTPLTQEAEAGRRRDFLKNVGRVASTAPAVALLLAAGSKPAHAQDWYTWGQSWQ